MPSIVVTQRPSGAVRRRVVLGVLALVLIAREPLAASNRKSWNKGLQEALGHLRAQEWKAAGTRAQKVIDAMIDDMAPGESADRAVGLMLMVRGLAEAGQGNEANAAWDWHLAQQFDPALETRDLAEFGVAGAVLDRHRLKNDPAPAALDYQSDPTIQPPEVTSRAFPRYGAAMRMLGTEGWVHLDFVVHGDGSLSHPRILERAPAATMTLSALDAARETRFRPALRAGEPVSVRFTFHLKFTLTPP